MISTVLQIGLLRLWNNKQELLLALLVPVLFFSIFALILGRGIGSDTPALKVAVVDDDASALSREVRRLLSQQSLFRTGIGTTRTTDAWTLDRLTHWVLRETDTDMVIHLPTGMEADVKQNTAVSVDVVSEGTNPMGRGIADVVLSQVIAAAVTKTLSRPEVGTTVQPAALVKTELHQQTASLRSYGDEDPPIAWTDGADLVSVETKDLFAEQKRNPKVAMYAAGIAVMFLLFSATGAGGSLLEEHEAGTLDRLLTSRLSLAQLLAGKWLYIVCLGSVQLTLMFIWAQIAFGVDLMGHVRGFAVMTICTAAATASLALALAVMCRSRAQLNGVSIVLILAMSALGGSMVPRYIMSDQLQRWGQWTFNAWALDGFKKVFWYDLPVAAVATEIRMLLLISIAMGCIAWLFADRWATN